MQKYYLHTEAKNGAYRDSNNVRYNLQEIAPENIHIPKSRQGEFALYETLEDYLISAGLVLSGEHEPTFDLAAAKETKKQELASARYNSEISGIEINGMQILTDFNTQSKITAAYLMAYTEPTYTINWKTANGFVTLNAQQIMAIGTAIRNHVQYQFDKEMELLEQAENATTIEELNSIVW
jgi:hypothetical protein